jgi:dienelactone hydrolase
MSALMKTLLAAAFGVLLSASPASAEQKPVSFAAADGFTLKGTFYTTGRGSPGILLLHQCGADANRGLYADLAGMLSTAGYNVLAFDWRGFGESKAGEYTDYATQREKIRAKMAEDAEAAYQFLGSQATVNTRAFGIVGGSCGVNQAIQLARRHSEVRTIVLLSGGTDAEGEAFVKGAPKLPIFGAASEEDANAAAAIKKTVALSTHPDSKVQMLKDAGHAASMFAKEPELMADIVMWFRSNLPVAGYGLPPAIK